MLSSAEPSVARERFARVLRGYGALRLRSQEKRLDADQVELLLSRVSADERKDILDTHRQCFKEAIISYGLPAAALALGSLYMVQARRYFYRVSNGSDMMKFVYYAPGGFFSFWAANSIGAAIKCKERVQPKVVQLWEKYGDADSTTNFSALSNQNREGAGLIPVNKSMSVDTEKGANVDDTFAPGTRHPIQQRQDTFTELSEAQKCFATTLRLFGGPDLKRNGKLILNDEQIQYLYNRIPSRELMDLDDTRYQCIYEAATHYGVPSAVATFIPLSIARDWLPAKYRFGPKGWGKYPFALYFSVLSFLIVGTPVFVKKAEERVQPKIDLLLKKYGSDESTSNYEAPSKGNREGAKATGLVSENKSMAVDTEKGANVDDTYAPRVRSPTNQRLDTFAYSDTFISGTPSGVTRERQGKFAYSD